MGAKVVSVKARSVLHPGQITKRPISPDTLLIFIIYYYYIYSGVHIKVEENVSLSVRK